MSLLDGTGLSLWPEALGRFEEGSVPPPHIPMIRGVLEIEEAGSFIQRTDNSGVSCVLGIGQGAGNTKMRTGLYPGS